LVSADLGKKVFFGYCKAVGLTCGMKLWLLTWDTTIDICSPWSIAMQIKQVSWSCQCWAGMLPFLGIAREKEQ